MKSKVLNETGERTIALIFDPEEEVMEVFTRFIRDQNINAARFTAIGAFSEATFNTVMDHLHEMPCSRPECCGARHLMDFAGDR